MSEHAQTSLPMWFTVVVVAISILFSFGKNAEDSSELALASAVGASAARDLEGDVAAEVHAAADSLKSGVTDGIVAFKQSVKSSALIGTEREGGNERGVDASEATSEADDFGSEELDDTQAAADNEGAVAQEIQGELANSDSAAKEDAKESDGRKDRVTLDSGDAKDGRHERSQSEVGDESELSDSGEAIVDGQAEVHESNSVNRESSAESSKTVGSKTDPSGDASSVESQSEVGDDTLAKSEASTEDASEPSRNSASGEAASTESGESVARSNVGEKMEGPEAVDVGDSSPLDTSLEATDSATAHEDAASNRSGVTKEMESNGGDAASSTEVSDDSGGNSSGGKDVEGGRSSSDRNLSGDAATSQAETIGDASNVVELKEASEKPAVPTAIEEVSKVVSTGVRATEILDESPPNDGDVAQAKSNLEESGTMDAEVVGAGTSSTGAAVETLADPDSTSDTVPAGDHATKAETVDSDSETSASASDTDSVETPKLDSSSEAKSEKSEKKGSDSVGDAESAENAVATTINRRPWLGVRMEIPNPKVVVVYPGSGSDDARVLVGDVILAINDRKTPTTASVVEALKKHAASETVDVTVIRGEEKLVLPTFLGKTRPTSNDVSKEPKK